MNQIVNINEDSCTGCGACVEICPVKILYLDEAGICRVTDGNRCDRLRGCERACPTGAITVAWLAA